MGSSIRLSATGTVLRKSGTLVLTKFFAAWAIVLAASQFIPPEGVQSGFFAGLSIWGVSRLAIGLALRRKVAAASLRMEGPSAGIEPGRAGS